MWIKCWELRAECAEKSWDLDDVKAHHTSKEKNAIKKDKTFYSGRKCKADEEADADDMCASVGYAVDSSYAD